MSIADRFTTYEDATQFYGISRRTLNSLVAKGLITAYRPGKRVLLDTVSLDRWFESTRVTPSQPIRKSRRTR